jgi:hypothetical protein
MYIDRDKLLKNYLISKQLGYVNKELKIQIILIVEAIMRRCIYHTEEEYRIIKWSAIRDVCKYCMNYDPNYDPNKFNNPFPYFAEITKRRISWASKCLNDTTLSQSHKRLTGMSLRDEYYWQEIIGKRKEKLQKLNSL